MKKLLFLILFVPLFCSAQVAKHNGGISTGAGDTRYVNITGDTMTGPLTLSGSTLTVTGNAFSVGGSTLVVTGGNVGIGTVSPGAKLDVKESGTETYTLVIGTSTTSTYDVVVTTIGNVGIGTTAPGAKLEVVGAVNASILQAYFNGYTTGLGIDDTGSYWGASIFQSGTKRFTVDSNGGVLIGNNYQGGTAPADGAIIEGKVGIGTTGPGAKLHAVETSGSPSYIFVASTATDSASYKMVVSTTGNVGIGTVSPGAKLDVRGTDGIRVIGTVAPETPSPDEGVAIGGGTTLGYGWLQSFGSGNELRINPNGNNVTLGGNVGIGTIAPGAKLETVGEVRTSTSTTSTLGLCLAGAFQNLPTSGYNKGCMAYQISNETLYVSTETVAGTYSWKPVW